MFYWKTNISKVHFCIIYTNIHFHYLKNDRHNLNHVNNLDEFSSGEKGLGEHYAVCVHSLHFQISQNSV